MHEDYKKILVGVDGSKESEKAFEKALSIAKKNDAKLVVVHVVDSLPFIIAETPYVETLNEATERNAKDLLASFEHKAKEIGYSNIEFLIESGSPKGKIVHDIVPQLGIDLVVCGATGTNAFERMLIGSVSEYIVRHAKCDVLISRLNDK